MKHFFLTLLLMTFLFLAACNNISTTKDGYITDGNMGSDAGTQKGKINVQNVEKHLRALISVSSLVVEATLCEIDSTDIRDEVYIFENIDVITGVYEEETLPLTIYQEEKTEYFESVDYQVGERYILIVQTTDSVNRDDDVVLKGSGILCQLNENNHESIENIYVYGCSMNGILKTKAELIGIIEEVVGLQHTYYNVSDKYVHSDKISDIVHGADIIAKVRIDDVNNKDDTMLIEICECTVLELLKGEIPDFKPGSNSFQIRPRRLSTKMGEEYLVLLNTGFEPGIYYQAAKKNAIIPMTDTDRVQQVYDALGIDPES